MQKNKKIPHFRLADWLKLPVSQKINKYGNIIFKNIQAIYQKDLYVNVYTGYCKKLPVKMC